MNVKEKGEPGKRMQKTERENKLNGRNTDTNHTSRSESTIITTSRHRVIYEKMRNSEHNRITNKK